MVKLKLSLFIAMKAYSGFEIQLHSFLILALDRGQWLASRPGYFTSCTHWLEDSVVHRPNLDILEKRKMLHTCQEFNYDYWFVQLMM